MVGFFRRSAAPLAVALVLAACSSGGGSEGGGAGGGGAASGGGGGGGEPAIAFHIIDARVTSMAAQPGPFPEDVWGSVVQILNAYLARAMVEPLRSGHPPAEVATLFAPGAWTRVVQNDQVSVLEDGTTAVSGQVTADRADAALELLTDRGGRPVLVNAAIDVALTVRSKSDAVAVARSGQVVLVNEEGGWRIDSYDLRATRDSQPL